MTPSHLVTVSWYRWLAGICVSINAQENNEFQIIDLLVVSYVFYSIQTLVHEFIHLSIYSLIYLCIGHLLCQAMSDVLDVQGELNRHSPDFMRTSLTEVL